MASAPASASSSSAPAPAPASVEMIFSDFIARYTGIRRALTDDVDSFYHLCGPDSLEGKMVCLYGHPDESWEVKPPFQHLPSELPEPAIGINANRDLVDRRAWLSMIAAHSHSWLLSIAFYHGRGLSCHERNQLFNMINYMPTFLEALNWNHQTAEKCGICDGICADHEFWVICDVCGLNIHGSCLSMTSVEDDSMCPSCKNSVFPSNSDPSVGNY